MKIDCQNFNKWYPRYKSKRLSQQEIISSKQHLLKCTNCSTLAEEIESAVESKVNFEPDPYFFTRFQARLNTQDINRSSTSWIFQFKPRNIFLYGFSIIFAVLMGYYTGRILLPTLPTDELTLQEVLVMEDGIANEPLGLEMIFEESDLE
ncbi:MAG: hypothetical protein GYA75_06530 [Bacteroidales bacterium]|nr:hypothetical protein [Bacteroidales bacterium]